MDIFSENKQYLLAISIPLTVLVLIASMLYTLRNITRIWNAGKPFRENENASDKKTEKSTDDEISDEETELDPSERQNLGEKGGAGDSNLDPVQYCEHIQSEVKKARHRVATKEIRQNLSAEDMEKEREIQRKQLEDIFKLMEQNSEKFGATSENDLQQQMRLYV